MILDLTLQKISRERIPRNIFDLLFGHLYLLLSLLPSQSFLCYPLSFQFTASAGASCICVGDMVPTSWQHGVHRCWPLSLRRRNLLQPKRLGVAIIVSHSLLLPPLPRSALEFVDKIRFPTLGPRGEYRQEAASKRAHFYPLSILLCVPRVFIIRKDEERRR